MASYVERLSGRDLATLAAIIDADPQSLAADLRRRPWSVNDLLSDPAVFETISTAMTLPSSESRRSSFSRSSFITSPASFARRPMSTTGPVPNPACRSLMSRRSRNSSRTRRGAFFLASLLASFATPLPPPVPANPARYPRPRQLGRPGPSLGPDRTASSTRGPFAVAVRSLSRQHRTTSARVTGGPVPRAIPPAFLPWSSLELCDGARISPGLDALETLGSRWYGAAACGPGVPPIVSDVAHRFRSARRILNHLSDHYLYRIEPIWGAVA